MAYGDDAGLTAYASARGATLPATSTERDQLRVKASVFVDGLGWRMTSSGVPISMFPGAPLSATQEMQWPRTGATDTYGNEIDSASVPGPVERATYEAAIYESGSSGALNVAVRNDERVVREKFDVIEFQYAEAQASAGGIAGSMPVIPAVMTILAPVLSGGLNAHGITGVVA